MSFFSKTTYIIIRLLILGLAVFLSYILVQKVINPKVFKKTCLTSTDKCLFMDIYKYKNSFLAQIYPSALWVWFNGGNIYIYGEAPGDCQDRVNYEPVFSITPDFSGDDPIYTFNPNECITKLDTVKDYYETQYKVKKERIYFKVEKPVNNVLDVVTILYKKKIIR